ncbi:MAG: Uma2 family endonuclease [Leptolyngbya sp. SIOISBB]|nr:Uma2 family endonuclease [Leptolyngbya sp. SIOISBB]
MVAADQTRILQTEAGPVPLPPNDLPSDEPPLESSLHLQQMMLLLNCLDWLWQDRNDYFAAGNLTIYYNARQLKSKDFRGPDFFVILGTEKRSRKSWMVWEEEGRYPNVIVELLSDSTAKTDRGLKKEIYQTIFRTPEYFWFSPDTLEFEGFLLTGGVYQAIAPNERGHRWSEQLQLFLGVHESQLRYFSLEGDLIPTPKEAAKAESQRAEAEQRRNAKLAAKLRELGIDPDELSAE